MTIGSRRGLRQFGGIITVAAHYLRVEPARLRRFVYEIDRSLFEDIERIDTAMTEYARSILERGKPAHLMPEPPKPTNDSGVFRLADAKRRKDRQFARSKPSRSLPW
jgi:hypothetical protein